MKGMLYSVLSVGDLEYNIYSYKLYVIPKLLMVPTFLTGKMNTKIFDTVVRKTFKNWLGVGKSLSTKLVYTILGTDPTRMSNFMATNDTLWHKQSLYDP